MHFVAFGILPLPFSHKNEEGRKKRLQQFLWETKLELHQYSLFFCPATEKEEEEGTL